METRLRKLFDYQRFEQNTALQEIIDAVHARHDKQELDMDEMETVYAAGQPVVLPGQKKERKE